MSRGMGEPAVPPAGPDDARVTVVYVLGAARSGTTLLTSLLGRVDGVAAVAELRLLWSGVERRACGCGQLATACPLWSQVLDGARAAALTDPDEVPALQRATTLKRHVPRLARAEGPGALDADTLRYARLMAASYGRIAEHTGARVVVDSSKSAAEAALLRHLPSIDACLVQLVRDPRAVVYSWQRAGAKNPAQGKSVPRAIGSWLSAHLTAEAVLRAHPPGRSLTIRYEDLAEDPERLMQRVADLIGQRLREHGATPASQPVQHMVGGNSLRMQRDAPAVRADTEWRERLPSAVACVVTAATVPLLRRYGYPLT